MIKFLERRDNLYIWEVDGIQASFGWSKLEDPDVYRVYIQDLKHILETRIYLDSPEALLCLFDSMGCIPFFRIGLGAFPVTFIEMFRYYARLYISEAYYNRVTVFSQIPSYMAVIGFMLYGNSKGAQNHGNWLVQSPTNDLRAPLIQVIQDEFASFCKERIKDDLLSNQNLKETSGRIGTTYLTTYCMEYMTELTEKIIRLIASSFTEQRKFISLRGVIKVLTGDLKLYSKGCDERFCRLLETLVQEEVEIQKVRFPAENHLELDTHKDIWTLYKLCGGSLAVTRYDFTDIKSASLRLEVKHYMIHRVNYGVQVSLVIAHALNILIKLNLGIRYAADITEEDARATFLFMEAEYMPLSGKKLKIATIKHIFTLCSGLLDYLMGDMRSPEIKSPKPYFNPFAGFRFVNINAYKAKTEIIPENVAEELDRHIEELDKPYDLAYRIFSNTGMRLKEVRFLKNDCIEPSRYEKVAQIKYTPYKVLPARRKAGLEDCHRVLIPADLATDILTYAQTTEKYRVESGLPYIFLSTQRKGKISMLSIGNLSGAINKLLRKYSICDETGKPWHFSTRQCRKTVAVTLIENGASVTELAYWLGHLSTTTARQYYAEVRQMKLAELNTAFFKKQFDLVLSEQQLAAFTEEERRLLYIDFRLERRRVEFGFCLLHPADGCCPNRNSLYNCANCRHLCTGKKHLTYWQQLLDEQMAYLEELLRIYEQEEITEYHNFKEYQQAESLFRCYQSIVHAIQREGEEQ